MNRRTSIGILLAVCAAILTGGCEKSASKPAAQPAVPSVSVAQPIPKRVNEWDEFTGRLASPQSVDVRARVSGYIEKVHFKEGSEVQQGDLLFSLDKRPYQAAVDRLLAELSAARSRLELARAEAKRAEGLAASQAISTEIYETRAKAAVQAEEAVRSAEANLKLVELDLEFTEVRAPISGRLSNARITAGNLVTGGSVPNATLLTTIVMLDPIYCYFEADETSVLKYRQLHREGKRVAAMFQSVPAEMELLNEKGYPHKGEVDFVDNQLNPATGTIRARAVFANPDRLMAPGFFARVRIPGVGEYDSLLVRDSAIGSDQGRSYVLVVDDQNKANYRTIKIGPIVEGLRVVREGLQASDRIIVTGLMAARSGSTVKPQLVDMRMTSTNSAAIATNATPAAPAQGTNTPAR
ncbi:MAG: efflux RND transporter periplasmic adaptor subunit [Verrucomicrobiales bacterium]